MERFWTKTCIKSCRCLTFAEWFMNVTGTRDVLPPLPALPAGVRCAGALTRCDRLLLVPVSTCDSQCLGRDLHSPLPSPCSDETCWVCSGTCLPLLVKVTQPGTALFLSLTGHCVLQVSYRWNPALCCSLYWNLSVLKHLPLVRGRVGGRLASNETAS